MRKSFFILAIALTASAMSLTAQRIVFSNFPQQHLFYNPAFAGLDSAHVISNSGMMMQSIFLENNITALATYTQPFGKYKNGFAMSSLFHTENDFQSFDFTGSYSRRFRISKSMNLRLGVSADIEFYHQFPYCPHLFFQDQYNNERRECFDPLPTFNLTMVFGGGGLRYEWKNFFAAYGFKNIIVGHHEFYGLYPIDKIYPLQTLTTGYKLKVSKSVSTLPSFMILVNGPALSLIVSNDVWFKKKVLLGMGYSANDNVNFRAGFCIKKKLTAMFSQAFNVSPFNHSYWNHIPSEATVQFRF